MIVVATNNGAALLPKALEAFSEFGTGGRPVCVVDTGSNNPEFLAYLQTLPERFPRLDITTTKTPYQGYDTGAYLWAYRNFEAESYMFTQDSIRPKQAGWISAFENALSPAVACVPWLGFPLQWETQEQVDFVRRQYRTQKMPAMGIFGPVFFAKRSALDRLDADGYLSAIPTNKIEQQAMERGWPTAFSLCDLPMRPLETIFDEGALRGDRYVYMTKTFAQRK